MSGRRFFTPQAGRADKSKSPEDEPWGTTSSQSHFKAYEASEARSARSGPAHVKPCLQTGAGGAGTTDLKIWERHREDYRDPYASSKASAVTASDRSSAGGSRSWGQKYVPAADLVAMRPIPERPFGGVSHYTEHQAEAQQARHDYFPYRDEFHPRSKRLLYEMALNKAVQGDRASVVSDDSQSCFTIASTAVSKKSGSSRASGVSRSSSMPGLNSEKSSRLPTGDSLRIGGGTIGSLAKRRREAGFRAPSQWEPDRQWMEEQFEKDGPAGISSANFPASMYTQSIDKYGQNLSAVSAMLDGSREHPVRERTNK